MAVGCPSSSSTPDSPPSPARPCIFNSSSLSSSAWVFLCTFGVSSAGLVVDFWIFISIKSTIEDAIVEILTICLSCENDFELGLASVEYVWKWGVLEIEEEAL